MLIETNGRLHNTARGACSCSIDTPTAADVLRVIGAWVGTLETGSAPKRLLVRLADGRTLQLPFPVVSIGGPGRRHSLDFCSVAWDGRVYVFTPNQTAIVKALWDAWEAGTPCVHGATLLEFADCKSNKMSDAFKGSPAWGTLIVEGPVKGTYRLAERINAKSQCRRRESANGDGDVAIHTTDRRELLS